MPTPDPIVIVGAARTPIGAFQGDLSGLAAPELGAAAIRAAVERAGLPPTQSTKSSSAACFPRARARPPRAKPLWARVCRFPPAQPPSTKCAAPA